MDLLRPHFVFSKNDELPASISLIWADAKPSRAVSLRPPSQCRFALNNRLRGIGIDRRGSRARGEASESNAFDFQLAALAVKAGNRGVGRHWWTAARWPFGVCRRA